MDIIDIYDYLLLPIYLCIFYFIIIVHSRKYDKDPRRKYFITAFWLHMLGTFLYCMMIQYYYGYGDSIGFYRGGTFIRNVVSNTGDPITPFFQSSSDYVRNYSHAENADLLLPTGIDVRANIIVMKISAALSYITFNSYLIISLFFGLFSFYGTWKLYKVMDHISGKRASYVLALLVLYLPSICFWGGGLTKDSICLGSIGLIAHLIHLMFVQKKFKIRYAILLLLLFSLLFVAKSYLAIVFLIATVSAYTIHVIVKSRNDIIKFAFITILILVSAGIIIASISSTLDSIVEDSKRNIEIYKGVYAAEDIENDISRFGLATTDFSISGILISSPMAIFTVLFRPFLLEADKAVIFFSALESLFTLLLTFFVLIRCRVYRFFILLFKNPYNFFCFVFTILTAVIIGFSTFNFGTLVRYRLPVLPFFFFLIINIYFQNKEYRLQKR